MDVETEAECVLEGDAVAHGLGGIAVGKATHHHDHWQPNTKVPDGVKV
ncbi:hypothetical protein [Streptomyces sp. NPDC021212]